MTPTEKARLIDKFNDEFLNEGSKDQQKAYEKYFQNVLGQVTQRRKTIISNKQIMSIVKNTPISTVPYRVQVYTSLILSGISNIIEKQKLDKQDKSFLLPIMIILAFYKHKPNLIAVKSQMMAKAFISGKIDILNKTDKKIYVEYKKYFNSNQKAVKELIIQTNKRIIKINRDIKSNVSKTIQKTLKREVNRKIFVSVPRDGEIVKVSRFQTYNEIREKLLESFGDSIDYRVKRIVDTELKELQERAKEVQHTLLGYTHKTWHTQLDSRVRKSHRRLQGKTIKINKKFRVGMGWGMYPGDPHLPIGERINERCYLTYSKRK